MILLIPPTHEQSNPSVHVPAVQARRFAEFLVQHRVPLARGSDALEPLAGTDIVEIEVEAGETPIGEIERLIQEFEKK